MKKNTCCLQNELIDLKSPLPCTPSTNVHAKPQVGQDGDVIESNQSIASNQYLTMITMP